MNLDTVDDLLDEVCGWSDVDWVKLVGKVAIQADKYQRLRLFWASGRPEARSMMTVIKKHIPQVEVREKESNSTTSVNYLAAIFKWEEGEVEIVEDRVRVVFEALASYLEDFQLSYGFRKHVEKQTLDMTAAVNESIMHLAVSFKGHVMSKLEFPDTANAIEPPDIRIRLDEVLENFCYIVSYASRVTYPPEIDRKFNTFYSQTERIWHPNVVLMVAAMVQLMFEDFKNLKTTGFQCALHLAIWNLGMAGEAPFKKSKENDCYVWMKIAGLLNLNYYKCMDGYNYRYG